MKYEIICSYNFMAKEGNGMGFCYQSVQSDSSDMTLTEVNNLLNDAEKELKEKGYMDINIFPMSFMKVIDDTDNNSQNEITKSINSDPNELYDEIKRVMNSGSLFMKSEEKEQKIDEIRKLLV